MRDYRRWTEHDLQRLKTYATRCTMEQLTKRLGRSDRAIWHKYKRMKIKHHINLNGWGMQELEEGFHVRNCKVHEWMDKEWLVGAKRGPNSTHWNFTDTAITRFLTEHVDALDPEVQQSLWVRDFLDNPFEYGMGRLG